MHFQPFGKLDEPRLRKFETDLGLTLPADYRQFLLENNGGTTRQARLWAATLERWVAVDCLFGLDLDPALDLRAWSEELDDELPPDALVIGSDPFGALLVLGCGENDAAATDPSDASIGVYLYDHAHQIPGSDDEGNAYRIAASWSALEAAMAAPADAKANPGHRVPDPDEAADHVVEDQAFAQKAPENSYWIPGGIDEAKSSGKPVSLQAVNRLQQARFTHQAAFAEGDS